MAEITAPRHLMLVLHDVAPQTWADYQPFVEAVDQLGGVPMTLLVVPDFHHHDALAAQPQFCRTLENRIALGDELALHGFFHADDGPPPNTPWEYFMRRIYTWEGEFYRLTEREAFERLGHGLDVFARQGWPVEGFVAPAWLMSEGTKRALRQLPLSYTSDTQHLYRLPDFDAVRAPGLVWSAGSAWRRGASRLISDWRLKKWAREGSVRLGLHPVDMRHPYSRQYWLDTLGQLLEKGWQPVTKHQWLAQQGQASWSAA